MILDYTKINYYYEKKYWSKEMVGNAVKMNKITAEEYEQITGEVYI